MNLKTMPNHSTVSILGIPVSRLDLRGAVEACLSQIQAGRGGYVCFANVHSLTEAKQDPIVRDAMLGSSFVFADGVPLVWTAKLKRQPIQSRVCGPDFMKAMLETTKGELHGFIGGAPGQAEKLAERFGVQAVCYSPPMRHYSAKNAREDWQEFLKTCPGGRAPRIIWVGLGAPKQERWMHAINSSSEEALFFGVGAAFDFLAGVKRRAPLWMQKLGLEWLFRLGCEPRRLLKRYIINSAAYLYFTFIETIK
jgi:N-acetylglucosaminyldiphosphoundecaprenol N-acetyl-beta-D-mannosaminyltransferase